MFRLALLAAVLSLATAPVATAQPIPTTSRADRAPWAPEEAGALARSAEQLLANFERTANAITPTRRTYTIDGQPGFVFGTGPADTKVGQAFTLPNGSGTALGVNLYFYARAESPVRSTYRVQVWSGSEASGPETELYSESFPISEIQLRDEGPIATEIRFASPVPVADETFFVVLPFDLNDVGDGLGLFSTQQLSDPAPESWHFVSPSWSRTSEIFDTDGVPVQSYALIEALVDDTPVSREALPEGVASVRLFPNPAPGAARLEVELERASGVEVTVLDVLGREVARVFSGALPAGSRVVDLGAERLPAATYVVRVAVDGVPVTRLLSLAR